MYVFGKCLLTAALAVVLSMPAVAQQGQGRGRGGFGGPGGGMFGGPGMLLRNEAVKKELKITEEQSKKIQDGLTKVGEKLPFDRSAFGQGQAPSEEQLAKMQERMKAMTEETTKVLDGILNADQRKRLNQISIQQRGTFAFSDPAVLKSLKLTDDQKESIKTISEDIQQEMREIRANRGNQEESQKKQAELRKESMERIMAVLKDDQKATWKDMTGAPFEVRLDFNRGGRPGGDRQPGGQRRQRNQNQNNNNNS